MFDKLKKYGNLKTYDIYKSLAFILMVIDHVGYYFLPSARLLRVIGRTSMIIFAVLHGFNRKKSSNNNRILIYAVLLFIFPSPAGSPPRPPPRIPPRAAASGKDRPGPGFRVPPRKTPGYAAAWR